MAARFILQASETSTITGARTMGADRNTAGPVLRPPTLLSLRIAAQCGSRSPLEKTVRKIQIKPLPSFYALNEHLPGGVARGSIR